MSRRKSITSGGTGAAPLKHELGLVETDRRADRRERHRVDELPGLGKLAGRLLATRPQLLDLAADLQRVVEARLRSRRPRARDLGLDAGDELLPDPRRAEQRGRAAPRRGYVVSCVMSAHGTTSEPRSTWL